MKVWLTVIAFFVLVLIFGPGCGGGGTSSGTGTTGGNIVRYAVEATKNGALIDPTNIVQGETVQFDVAGYTDANQRIVQASSGWQADPTGQTEGSMNGNGLYTATASGNGFTVSATVAGAQYVGPAQVRNPGALVTGRLIDGVGGTLHGVEVDFFDAGGTIVDTSLSQWNGTFRASMPTSAVTFEVNKNTIPNGIAPLPSYYKEYEFTVLHGTTTVSAGAASATQHLASTTGIVPGYVLHFGAENADRIVQSVTNSTTVVLTASVASTTGETVTIVSLNWFLPQGLCRAPLPVLTNGQTTALHSDVLIPPKYLNTVSFAPPPPPSSCGP